MARMDAFNKINETIERQTRMHDKLAKAVAAVFPQEKLTKTHSSLETYICRVSVRGYMFSALESILLLIPDDILAEGVRTFVDKNPIKESPEGGVYTRYFFLEDKLNIWDITELRERFHLLYLDPAYCQNSNVSFQCENHVFSTRINGTKAYFSIKDVKDLINHYSTLASFRTWVSRTQDGPTEPFYSVNMKHIYEE